MKINEFINDETNDEHPNLGWDVVGDLHVHMKNDPMFYRKEYYPTIASMQDSLKQGNPIDTKKAIVPMINKGMEHYCAKYDIPRRRGELLQSEDIDALVEKIYGEEMELIQKGDY